MAAPRAINERVIRVIFAQIKVVIATQGAGKLDTHAGTNIQPFSSASKLVVCVNVSRMTVFHPFRPQP